ncbi:MAG TPA: IS200/IS605 family transposase [Candidatus Babeliales bacterium]|nr:IS200/IS605 family transposase [Candidatus Babeliales bacterium]
MGILKNMSKYWHGSQTKHRLMYHLVWIPKYRKRVLNGEIADRIKELLYECADFQRWKIEELNIQPDHIHMLVQMNPDVSVSRMVQLFKGMTSKVVREEFPELKEFLWGKSFWSDGYFAETSGQVNENRIREYIRNQ